MKSFDSLDSRNQSIRFDEQRFCNRRTNADPMPPRRCHHPACILELRFRVLNIHSHEVASFGSNGLGPPVSPIATMPDGEIASLPSSSAPNAFFACFSRSGVAVAQGKHTHDPPGPYGRRSRSVVEQ
ncbi:hypothetical protein [Rhodococcus sp. IEGM 1366]|uniref:hypothetical protein n=1 Tax=Rhodococcus sp. IEGM 1366 TaxID=3082223 RepID=UPI0029536728|nr:hypothetical protein [Rhodococcus sp. IEGM 1366]